EDLSVADAAGLGRAPDRVDGPLDQFIGNHDLDFYLWQEIDDVFSAPVEFGMSLLPPKPLGFSDGDALQAYFLKRFLYLVELEWLDDGFDFLHRSPPGHLHIRGTSGWFDVARGRAGSGCLARRPGAFKGFTGRALTIG